MNLQRSFYTILMLALLTLLAGCPAQMGKMPTDFDDLKDSAYYLSQAESSSGSAKIDWQLLAIQAMIRENKLPQAKTLLSNLPSDLNVTQQQNKLLSQGEIAVQSKQPFNFDGLSIDKLSDAQLFRYYSIKLAFDRQDKNVNGQAHNYVALAQYAPAKLKNNIINETWQFINQLSQNDLQLIVVYANETTLQGWLDLVYAYRNNAQTSSSIDANPLEPATQSDNQQLKQAIYNWSLQYPDHPAKALMRNLTGEQSLTVDDANAKKVALFLPLGGSSKIFGETIRQGYIDATNFYPQEPKQNIIMMDTSSAPLNVLVEQATQQGAEIIVGPLLKNEVIEIQKLAPSIPVLALNKLDNSFNASANKMCYFAISPEDEAKDAAQHIYAEHKTKPLLLVPQTDLGKRVAQSFAQQWQISSGGGSQAYVQYFDNAKTLSANMNRNVGINLTGDPIMAGGDVLSYSGQATGFDAIYVYASYDELTFIKPMIEMKTSQLLSSASSPTMYTSTKSHVVNASTDFNYDMERVQFAEIPMIVNQASITATIPANIKNDYSLMRLYAMGIDAWRLANRFNQLNSNQQNVVDGMTGKLSTINQCDIVRTLSWQQYLHGSSQSIN